MPRRHSGVIIWPKFIQDVAFLYHGLGVAGILMMPRGNAMLVGVGGSGRSSMAKLAAYCCEMTTFSIEITKSYKEKEFHEDIKTLLKKCALDEEIV